MKNLKQRIKSGEAVHGTWLGMDSLISAEILGHAGFDWVLIDMEHGAFSETEAFNMLRTLKSCPTTPLVRIESHSPQRTGRILDMGAKGVMFPQVRSAEEARLAISGMYYPPQGKRGGAMMAPAVAYGDRFDEYKNGLPENILGIVQIETPGAVAEIDEIASLPLVDVLFVGPLDLSMTMGIYGTKDHPDFINAMKKTVKAAKKYGKAAGILLLNADQYERYYDWGFRMIACGVDAFFLKSGAELMARTMDKLRAK